MQTNKRDHGRLKIYEKKLQSFSSSKYAKRDAGSMYGPLGKMIERKIASGGILREETLKKLRGGLKGMMLTRHNSSKI